MLRRSGLLQLLFITTITIYIAVIIAMAGGPAAAPGSSERYGALLISHPLELSAPPPPSRLRAGRSCTLYRPLLRLLLCPTLHPHLHILAVSYSPCQGDGLHQRRTWLESLGHCFASVLEDRESAEKFSGQAGVRTRQWLWPLWIAFSEAGSF